MAAIDAMKVMSIAKRMTKYGNHRIKNFKMAAVVAKGGAVLSTGGNLGYVHAEIRALKPHRNFEGCTIYVARFNGLTSRPCNNCMKAIALAGIRTIVYHDQNGLVKVEKVNKGDYNGETWSTVKEAYDYTRPKSARYSKA